MRRLAIACGLSLLFYTVAFALGLDRPLSLGSLRAQLDAKLARGSAIDGPKLVIIAGSNGPYSQRVESIQPVGMHLARLCPCPDLAGQHQQHTPQSAGTGRHRQRIQEVLRAVGLQGVGGSHRCGEHHRLGG